MASTQERCYDALPQANTGPDPEGTDEVMRHRDRSHLTQITCTNNKLGPAYRESKGAMYIASYLVVVFLLAAITICFTYTLVATTICFTYTLHNVSCRQ